MVSDDEIERQRAALQLLEGDDEYIGANGEDPIGMFAPDEVEVAHRVEQQISPNAGDGLGRAVAQRQSKWHDLNRKASFARIQPPSILQGTPGGQQTVINNPGWTVAGPFSPTNLPSIMQVALWGAGEDAETAPVSVTFAPVSPQSFSGEVPSAPVIRPYGIIKFGTRGFLVRAEVDIGQGVQLTVSGSMVSLEVALDPVENSLGVGGSASLAGMLSFFPIVRTQNITRTKYVPPMGGGGEPTAFSIPRPPYAQSVILVHDAVAFAAETYTIDFLDSSGTAVYSYNVPAGGLPLAPIPLSGDIFYVSVRPTAGAVHASRLIFNLAL